MMGSKPCEQKTQISDLDRDSRRPFRAVAVTIALTEA
jgi:hypothetical protein